MILSSIRRRRQFIAVLSGPAVFALSTMLLQSTLGFKESIAVATTIWMALWWVLRPVNISVTALLPIAINAIFELVPMKDIISQYFSEIIVLLFGADIICMTWSTTGLDKRFSIKSLCLIGTSMKQQITVWFIMSAFLSMFLPNVVVCTILVPVAVSMLHFIGEKNIKASKTAVPILLAIVWGAGIGGFGTPLGGAANLVAISYLENISGEEFMYVDWVIRFLPFLLIISALNIFFLCSIKLPSSHIEGTESYFKKAYDDLGTIKRSELISLLLFAAATILSFARPAFADMLPGMKPAYIFLTLSLLTFVITDDGIPLMTWEQAESGVMWGMLFLFAGGLALGQLVTGTGAAAKIAQIIAEGNLTGGFGTIMIFTLFACGLSEISSNTAAAAISVPVVHSITMALGLNPIPYLFVTIVAFNSAYILPVSIRAIPVGYGLKPSALFHNGFKLALFSILTISIAGYFFIEYWPLFSAL